jgi:hypothetical protein
LISVLCEEKQAREMKKLAVGGGWWWESGDGEGVTVVSEDQSVVGDEEEWKKEVHDILSDLVAVRVEEG